MKFTTVLTTLAFLSTTALADTLIFNRFFDDKTTPLDQVACSDGANGLITRYGYRTFGSIPRFPHIGGVPAITSWNSPNCATCWELTYINAQGGATSINVLGIDSRKTGYSISLAAMNELTNGQATQLGQVDVTPRQVAQSVCGF